MRGDTKTQLHRSSVANLSLAIGEIDFDVVMIEEHVVERIERLVHGLLGNEEQPSSVRVMSDIEPLSRCRDNFQQLGRQAFRRFHIYSNRAYVTARSDCGHRNKRIMAERADDPRGPDRRSGRISRQGAFRRMI